MKVNDILRRRALGARSSARELQGILAEEARDTETLVIDFDGIGAIAPSFVDEILTMVAEMRTPGLRRVVFANAPMRHSLKFSMLADAHSQDIEYDASGERETWILTPSAAPTAAR